MRPAKHSQWFNRCTSSGSVTSSMDGTYLKASKANLNQTIKEREANDEKQTFVFTPLQTLRASAKAKAGVQ